jgi:hypothetical protein
MWPALRPLSWNGWLEALNEAQSAQDEEERREDEKGALDDIDQNSEA